MTKKKKKNGKIQCQTQIKTKKTASGILSKEIKTQQPLHCIYKIKDREGQQQKQQKPGKRKYIYEEDDDDNADEDYKRKKLDAIKSFEYRRKEHTLRNTSNTFRVLVVFDATNTYVPSPITEPVPTLVITEPTSNVLPPSSPRPDSPQPIGEKEKRQEEEGEKDKEKRREGEEEKDEEKSHEEEDEKNEEKRQEGGEEKDQGKPQEAEEEEKTKKKDKKEKKKKLKKKDKKKNRDPIHHNQ